jgi:preprotein translocase subunit YajC
MDLSFLMHPNLIYLAQATTTTVAKNTKSSSSYVPLLVIIVIFALVYFLFLRPRQQRLRQQQTSSRQLSVGDEVMSAGGIYGRVVALDDDEVEVEVAPGVVMTFIRRAVSARQKPSGGARETPEPADEPWHLGPQGSADSGTGGPATETGGEDYPPAPGPTGG